MIPGKFLLVAVCFLGASLAQESFSNVEESLKQLKSLTGKAQKAIDGTRHVLNSAEVEFEEMIKSRLNCIEWEYTTQKDCLNKSIAEGVLKGMLKNKPFASFQCIGNAAREAGDKLNATFSKLPETVQRIRQKLPAAILPFRQLLPAFDSYVRDFYVAKHDEIIKAKQDTDRKKVLEEAAKKVQHLEGILEQVEKKTTESRFAIFSEFVDLIHATETNLKKFQREGRDKILKCVA